MPITAVICNHNYGRYLRRCIDSALLYCDEVLVYDDGSTDDSMSILDTYDSILVTHRDDSTGDPVWGSNLGIEQATSDYLIFLDADNYLVGPPPQLDYDYVFCPILVVDDNENRLARWTFREFPTDVREAYARFQAMADPNMPFPWGGVWRTSFLKGKVWRGWETTQYAQDMRFCIDLCHYLPTLCYRDGAFLVFRTHPGQWSEREGREQMKAEARLAQREPLRG